MSDERLKTIISSIRERGYGKLENAVSQDVVSNLLKKLKALSQLPKVESTRVPFLNVGHDMLYSLQNKDLELCKLPLQNSAIQTVMKHFLNDEWYRSIPKDKPNYLLRSLLARSGGPSAMPLHIDSFIPGSGSYAWSLQVAIVLEDQTVENGCTIVVPGSHLYDRYATQDAVSEAVPLTSKAGDLVFWDSRLWHGALANKTDRSRWAIIATFGRWWLKQNYDIPRNLPQDIYAQLSNSERAQLGFCSFSPRDETERIDIKGGYDILKQNVTDHFEKDGSQNA